MNLTQKLEKKISQEMEDKHWDNFSKRSSYKGNGVYGIMCFNKPLFSTDTRELFLMYIATHEKIKYTT